MNGPPTERSRPAGNGPANTSLANIASLTPTADETVRTAERLAEAWAPALSQSWHMGYGVGHRVGWHVGRDAERTAWNEIIGVYGAITSHPTRVAIEAAQAEPIKRCRRAASGRCCSACTRVAAMERNRTRYGSADFPGVAGGSPRTGP